MDLSIIIVSWNAKSFLQKSVDSVFRETRRYKTEVTVVDNASTDGSPELIKEKFPQVLLICNDTNLGFARANNIGIRKSSGKHVLLVNSDVEVTKGCIDRMVEYMEQNADVGMLGPQIIGTDGKYQRSCMGFPTLWNTFCRAMALDTFFPKSKIFGGFLLPFWEPDTIQQVDVINGCFWMVRREALDQVGLLDESFFIYAEDIDWCKRFWDAGWKVVYIPQAQAIHYGGASSSQAPVRFYIEMQRSKLQYWKKHHGRAAQVGFLLITGLHQTLRLTGEMFLYLLKPAERADIKFKIRRSIACIQWIAGFSRQ